MRFESIAISNYRQYRSLDVGFPKTAETDLHVIVASNGIGKTNMLNAINWCLYGDEPHLGDKDDSLTICNHVALEEARKDSKKFASVSVRIDISTASQKITFERSVDVNVSTRFEGHDHFKALITDESGNTEILEDGAADEIVNQYLPRKIRQYFFFDGEQLHNYFGQGQDTSHVKDSIHEIAQVSVVINTRQHLEKIIDEYQKEIAKLNPAVDDLSEQIESKKADRNKLLDELKALGESIKESEDTITTLNQQINGTETIVADNQRYNDNITLIEQLDADEQTQQATLQALVRKYYVLLMMYDVNASTSEYIEEKYQKGGLPPDINIDLIKSSLEHHECMICKAKTSQKTEDYLNSLINKYGVSTTVSHKLVEIKNDVARAVKEAKNYQKEKQKVFCEMRKISDRKSALTAENEELYKKISACSSIENIGLWLKQREDNRKLVQINTEKVGAYKTQVEALSQTILELEAQLASAIADVEKCEEIKHALNFATDAKKIITDIENEIVSEVRTQMESETMKLFRELIWKKNTYGHIELDENYHLRLFHKITNESCLGSCSAAERELLALAFTIALHRVSGHDCLLFIDTPVGRVSDINRENFAKALITVSKNKQLILAFTPAEYSIEIRKYFDDTVVSSFNKMVSSVDEETTRQEV